jgi:hypothetical protein
MATLANALALLRFGHFRFHHLGHFGRGGSGILLLVGVVFAGVLIWALTRSRQSTN